MNELMDYSICEKEHIYSVEVDLDRVNSLLKMAHIELDIIDSIELNSLSASKIAKDYYDVMKDLLIALLLSKGLKSKNHECLLSYFAHNYNYDFELQILRELKFIRNRISYDGFFVDEDYVSKNKLEFKHMYELLIKLIKTEIKNGT